MLRLILLVSVAYSVKNSARLRLTRNAIGEYVFKHHFKLQGTPSALLKWIGWNAIKTNWLHFSWLFWSFLTIRITHMLMTNTIPTIGRNNQGRPGHHEPWGTMRWWLHRRTGWTKQTRNQSAPTPNDILLGFKKSWLSFHHFVSSDKIYFFFRSVTLAHVNSITQSTRLANYLLKIDTISYKMG